MDKVRKVVDLSALPYKHRKAAADLLISKAQRLGDFIEGADVTDEKKARQAVSYFDIALQLMKPFDYNYSTIINWKCIILVGLKQYNEACLWYEELIRLAIETDGPNYRDPTAKHAKTQLKKYKGKPNAVLAKLDTKIDDVLDEPGFCWWANQFCDALENRKYKVAHEHLSAKYGSKISHNVLKKEWLNLLDDPDAEVEVNLINHSLRESDDAKAYLGCCYFAVTGDDINEAISVEVFQQGTKAHEGYEIRKVEFGRP